MKKYFWATLLSTTLLASAVFPPVIQAKSTKSSKEAVKIAIFSDPHYYAPELGTSGEAFEKYLAGDRKLLAESKAILESAVEAIKKSDVDLVLVSGDLTKDGEYISHKQFTEYLKQLEEAGKQVFVIDGNHDINNPHAVKFEGDQTTPVQQVTPSRFKSLYKDFGYSEAIAKDRNSLSYVVEPVEGLRILVMDSALYDTNKEDNYPKTGGAFSSKRLNWIKEQLEQAQNEDKFVIGMMHHGIVEHFSMQEELFKDYVVDDWEDVSKELAEAGLKVVFSGHFHANDVVKKEVDNDHFLFDIETGSLLTYPSPYRIVEVTPNEKMTIRTKKITDIDYDMGGKKFPAYAKEFLIAGLNGLVPQMLAGVLIEQGMPPQDAIAAAEKLANTEVAPSITVKALLVNAMVAHYQGDERMDKQTKAIVEGMQASSDPMTQLLGNALTSLLNDPSPRDNNLTIDLKTGKVTR
ncbi:metallophosphoesterase family protein [Brevibacillus sp. SYSU BS000544]|uniref:metallophosphoesterase family protein n=1 Tax=Brevibacillus sp. SYSU BS000544 TaxID=3416443 RepID=UPI003CE4E986